MKAESPDKGTIAQVYLLRPVLPHLRTRIPKVENIKMPVAYGIEKDSVILLEQLRTIDKRRLKDKVCHLDSAMLDKVNHALEISLELTF